MKLAVIGSRGFLDYELFCRTIYRFYGGDDIILFDELVSGGAAGADKMAERWVKEYNSHYTLAGHIKMTVLKPDWSIGKHAGFLRNEQIIYQADEVLAFWDGESRGTANSLSHAKKSKKTTLVVYF